MNSEELKAAIEKHTKWLNNEEGGERANLRWADLRWADLEGVDLFGADLGGADLRDADLRRADLSGADLSEADLEGACLRGATGNGREVSSYQFKPYHTVVAYNTAYVGCETHTVEEWLSFDEDRIREMDGEQAVNFYKNILKPMLTLHTKGLL